MAYPTVSAPYGLKPINRLDGLPYAGAIRQIPIASTLATAIYNGQPVKIVQGGTIAASPVTDSNAALANAIAGVFVGCAYVNSQGQSVEAQYYPGNAAATSAVAYVVDDPNAVFKVAVTAANSAMSTTTEAAVGTNVQFIQGTPSSTSGDAGGSILAPSASAGNAATLPFRVIAVVPDTNVTATTFSEVIVKINVHQYNTAAALDFA